MVEEVLQSFTEKVSTQHSKSTPLKIKVLHAKPNSTGIKAEKYYMSHQRSRSFCHRKHPPCPCFSGHLSGHTSSPSWIAAAPLRPQLYSSCLDESTPQISHRSAASPAVMDTTSTITCVSVHMCVCVCVCFVITTFSRPVVSSFISLGRKMSMLSSFPL